jgi:hypothetical protein
VPLIVGGAVFAGGLGAGGGGGGDDNGGGELIGVNGGDRVQVVVGDVPTVTGDDGAFGFLTFTHRWTRV